MESYDSTKAVLTRVQNIDPKNAWRIMGYIFLHYNQNDMIRFACGPETLIISIVNRAKTDLGISSNTLCASNIRPISNPIQISKTNPFSHSLSSPRLPNNGFDPSHSLSLNSNPNGDFHLQQDHNLWDPLANNVDFVCGVSPGCMSDSVVYPYGDQNIGDDVLHRRSPSFNDACYGNDELGGCDVNNNSCVPCKFDGFESCEDDVFGSKFAHQQRLTVQLMANRAHSPFNKLNLMQYGTQRSALAMMMEEELQMMNRARMARNEFMRGDSNHAARQIYLTFPADSTFKEDDVTQYFSRFGPVEDVRIPYQQKRMFGFVTFVYPETVNFILAKGNPHFVCDSRVLVKPYKEKGNLRDKKYHPHQLERAEFMCSSPPGLDSRDPFDFQLGGRMSFSTQEMLLKKHLEEQVELQSRRMMNLQVLDLNNHQHNQHNLAVGSPVISPIGSQASLSRNASFPSDGTNHVFEESKESPNGFFNQQLANDSNSDVRKEDKLDHDESELPESFEHVLPDNLFASPTKSDAEIKRSVFCPASVEIDGVMNMGLSSATSNNSSIPAASLLNIAPRKSCLFEMTRLSSEHETPAIKAEEQHAE